MQTLNLIFDTRLNFLGTTRALCFLAGRAF
jgi:hypothetical protein